MLESIVKNMLYLIQAVAICKNLRPPDLHARDPWFPGRRPIEQPSTHVILVISRIKRLKEVQKNGWFRRICPVKPC